MSPGPERLRRLLRPQTVAFVGGEVARSARAACDEAGFAGPVWEVHPSRQGAFPSVADLPEAPDAVFVGVNARATVDVVRTLAGMGAGGAACYAAGFSEAGTAEGEALEAELRQAAGAMPVLGPNCYGVIDAMAGVSVWPVPWQLPRVERGVAIVLQSGNLGINVTMSQRSLPIAFVASVGNQAALEIAEVVDAYLEQEEVTGIGIYLEGLRDVPRFAAAAASALERGVPLAVCKAGRSALGQELAFTHTASLAGSDELYEELFSRYGVARAATVPELLETLKALTIVGPLRGPRCFAFTCSGAESALVADAAASAGLDLPQPSAAVRAALGEALPEFALVGNPLDYNSALWGQEEPLRRVFTTALRDPADAALLVIDYPLPGVPYETDVDSAIRALRDATLDAGIPAAVASVLPESFPQRARDEALTAGLCPLQGLDEALGALGACGRLGARLTAGRPPVYPAVTEAAAGAVSLDERAAKEVLAAAGVSIPAGRLVSPHEAGAAAAALGFPVVAKLASPDLPHKAVAGAVSLGLSSGEEVDAAVGEMLARHSGLSLSGVIVERMVEEAVCELLVGSRHDPAFGHVLVVGSGGVLVELVADTVALLPPVERGEVEAAFRRLRIWPRLAVADISAAVGAVLAIAGLLEREGSRILELEVNPLLVLRRGAVAVDALCRAVPTAR